MTLRNLSNSARKNELEFNMQVSSALQLRGFIDLVFEYKGKAYILDWKSNWLGADAQTYQAPALQQAMHTNQYDLQARIYALAVHRWLAKSLGKQYQYERHFGGVIYLFLRGVGLNRDAGIHCWRPSEPEITKLQQRGPL
jgi:exodeoxyribonuclease V beta subunit